MMLQFLLWALSGHNTTGAETVECALKLMRTHGLRNNGKNKITIVQVPFPDGFRITDTSFSLFEQTLEKKNVNPESVAGAITET